MTRRRIEASAPSKGRYRVAGPILLLAACAGTGLIWLAGDRQFQGADWGHYLLMTLGAGFCVLGLCALLLLPYRDRGPVPRWVWVCVVALVVLYIACAGLDALMRYRGREFFPAKEPSRLRHPRESGDLLAARETRAVLLRSARINHATRRTPGLASRRRITRRRSRK